MRSSRSFSRLLAILLLSGAFLPGAELTVTAGAQITPDKTAINQYGVWPQDSRVGPSAGMEYIFDLGAHQGIGFLVDYANTDTRLANMDFNTWTMTRLVFAPEYVYRFRKGRFSPFLKAGVGGMITVSGKAAGAPDAPGVGLDGRTDEIAGVGMSYAFSRHFSVLAEYDCNFFRNPDFTDHTWHPQRNEVSEPKIGLTYRFGRE